eukprot:1935651-Rhodomonas_salina.2
MITKPAKCLQVLSCFVLHVGSYGATRIPVLSVAYGATRETCPPAFFCTGGATVKVPCAQGVLPGVYLLRVSPTRISYDYLLRLSYKHVLCLSRHFCPEATPTAAGTTLAYLPAPPLRHARY